MPFTPRVFSGIQPSGDLHLGNYLGAIKRFVEMQKTHECIYCVVDMHAITVWQEPDDLRRCDPRNRRRLYRGGRRSQKEHRLQPVAACVEHAELAWIFNCVARMGWMNAHDAVQGQDRRQECREPSRSASSPIPR